MKNTQTHLSLQQARAINAVAETRGIENASRLLNISQSVISRKISTAEGLLGVPLFQRGWSGTEPTAWGESVLIQCRSALNLIEKAEDDIEILSQTRPKLLTFLRMHHIDAVAAVVQFGSASQAANHLGVTQPSISKSITTISNYCAQPLFIRKRNGLIATPQAQRLTLLRDDLIQKLHSTSALNFNSKDGLIGRLAVGLLPFSGQDFVAKAFGTLTNHHPDLRLIAVPGSYSMLAEALIRGEIDCIAGVLRSPTPYSELQETFLYNEKFTLVARRDHHCQKSGLSISDLKYQRWIVAPHGTPVRTFFESLFRKAGTPPPTQTCEILSFGHAEKLIANSDSIGLLTYSDHHISNFPIEIKKLEIDIPNSEIPIGLTTKKSNGDDNIIEVFENLMREYCISNPLTIR